MQEILSILRNTASSPGLLLQAVVDIILVAFPFYVIFALLRGSRAPIALWGFIAGLMGSLMVYLLARFWNLQATALIFERFWIVVVFAFLILFQSELKKGLADFGRWRILRGLFAGGEEHVITEVIRAVQSFEEKKIGALIVFERAQSLRGYTTPATILDCEVSTEMIRSVFMPLSPLHDGALIIRGDRLLAARCILPLSDDPGLSPDLGTRHRAAIGLTEESDAVVVIVSEETGVISLAHGGRIERYLKADELRRRLEGELALAPEPMETEITRA